MLKIKDDVDLNELEKFGFKKCWSDDEQYYDGKFTIQKNRHIRSKAGNHWNGLDSLFDLIKAGFVEKVKEKQDESVGD